PALAVPVAPPPLLRHRRSAADPVLAPVAHRLGSDRWQYQSVSRWSSAPPRADTAARPFPVLRGPRRNSELGWAPRSLHRHAWEWLCRNAGRRLRRVCALGAWGWLSGGREKRVRLVACWLAALLPIVASAFRFPGATVPVPGVVVPAPGAAVLALAPIAFSSPQLLVFLPQPLHLATS